MYNDKKEYVQRDFDCIDNAGFIPLAEYFSLEARDAHAIHLVFYCYACKFFRLWDNTIPCYFFSGIMFIHWVPGAPLPDNDTEGGGGILLEGIGPKKGLLYVIYMIYAYKKKKSDIS